MGTGPDARELERIPPGGSGQTPPRDVGDAHSAVPLPGDPDWRPPETLREAFSRARAWVDRYHARWSEIARWALIAISIALFMLVGTAIASTLVRAPDLSAGQFNILTGSTDQLDDWLYLVVRNHLVLGIHFGACLIGAIIGRRRGHRRQSASHAFNPDLPRWVSYAALWYAWVVTLTSIVVQTIKIGEGVADVAAYLHVLPALFVLMLLPHALIELSAIFLPLALFMREARAGRLEDMGLWSAQAALIASPLIVLAAGIEVWISPHIITVLT